MSVKITIFIEGDDPSNSVSNLKKAITYFRFLEILILAGADRIAITSVGSGKFQVKVIVLVDEFPSKNSMYQLYIGLSSLTQPHGGSESTRANKNHLHSYFN